MRHRLVLGGLLAIAGTAAACTGEAVLTAETGSFTTGPLNATTAVAGSFVSCSFLIRLDSAFDANRQALEVGFGSFSLDGSADCDGSSSLTVYDGATTLAPVLARYFCSASASLVSLQGAVLLELSLAAGTVLPGFTINWAPPTNVRRLRCP